MGDKKELYQFVESAVSGSREVEAGDCWVPLTLHTHTVLWTVEYAGVCIKEERTSKVRFSPIEVPYILYTTRYTSFLHPLETVLLCSKLVTHVKRKTGWILLITYKLQSAYYPMNFESP